jgi:hypothetical protein
MAWRSEPAEPYKPRRKNLSDQFDILDSVEGIPYGAGFGEDDPHAAISDSGPQPDSYNHPDDYHADRKRYERNKAKGKGFIDRDRQEYKRTMKAADAEQGAPVREQYEEDEEGKRLRKERRHDVARIVGAGLIVGVGLPAIFSNTDEVPIISKVNR